MCQGRQVKPAILSMVETLLAAHGRDHGRLEQMAFFSNPDRRGKICLYLFEGRKRRPSFVVKLARTEHSRRTLRHEKQVYQDLLTRNAFLRSYPPRLYYDTHDAVFVLETFIRGGRVLDRLGTDAHEDLAVDWLLRFQATRGDRRLHRADLAGLVSDLCRTVRADGVGGLADSLEEWVANLRDFELSDVPIHGDYTSANLLLDDGRVFATDWEWVRTSGWPFEDIWFYLVYASGLWESDLTRRVAATVPTLLGKTRYSARARQTAYAFANAGGYPKGLVPGFALVTLLQRAVENRAEHLDWRQQRAGVCLRVLTELDKQTSRFWAYWKPT